MQMRHTTVALLVRSLIHMSNLLVSNANPQYLENSYIEPVINLEGALETAKLIASKSPVAVVSTK